MQLTKHVKHDRCVVWGGGGGGGGGSFSYVSIPCPQLSLPYHHENMAILIARNSLSRWWNAKNSTNSGTVPLTTKLSRPRCPSKTLLFGHQVSKIIPFHIIRPPTPTNFVTVRCMVPWHAMSVMYLLWYCTLYGTMARDVCYVSTLVLYVVWYHGTRCLLCIYFGTVRCMVPWHAMSVMYLLWYCTLYGTMARDVCYVSTLVLYVVWYHGTRCLLCIYFGTVRCMVPWHAMSVMYLLWYCTLHGTCSRKQINRIKLTESNINRQQTQLLFLKEWSNNNTVHSRLPQLNFCLDYPNSTN